MSEVVNPPAETRPLPGIKVGHDTFTPAAADETAVKLVATEIARDAVANAAELGRAFKDGVQLALLAGHHKPGGPLWDAVFDTVDGQFLRLWALLHANHPEFTREHVAAMRAKEPEQCRAVLKATAEGFMRVVGSMVGLTPEEVDTAAVRLRMQQGG